MTYRQLLTALNQYTDTQLDSDVTVYLIEDGQPPRPEGRGLG